MSKNSAVSASSSQMLTSSDVQRLLKTKSPIKPVSDTFSRAIDKLSRSDLSSTENPESKPKP